MGKFQVLTVLGAVFPHFSIGKRKIWHPRGPLSKRNTGMLTCGIIKKLCMAQQTSLRCVLHVLSPGEFISTILEPQTMRNNQNQSKTCISPSPGRGR